MPGALRLLLAEVNLWRERGGGALPEEFSSDCWNGGLAATASQKAEAEASDTEDDEVALSKAISALGESAENAYPMDTPPKDKPAVSSSIGADAATVVAVRACSWAHDAQKSAHVDIDMEVPPMARILKVRAPWIDLILDGVKTWEIRSGCGKTPAAGTTGAPSPAPSPARPPRPRPRVRRFRTALTYRARPA